MAIKDEIKGLLRESFPEMLVSAKACIDYRKTDPFWKGNATNGCLGYPAAITLFCVVDAIGSYYIDNDAIEIVINNERTKIEKSDEHFKILNSKYYGQNLSGDLIKAIYEYRCHLVHNLAMPGQHILNIGNENDEVFDLKGKEKGGHFPFINLLPFYRISEMAVNMFLKDLDSISYESYRIKTISAKDAKLKPLVAALPQPSSGIINFPVDSTLSGSTSTLRFVTDDEIKGTNQ